MASKKRGKKAAPVSRDQEQLEDEEVRGAEEDEPTGTGNPPAGSDPAPEPRAEDEPEPEKPKPYGVEARNAIYSNARRQRESDKPKDFDALDDEGKIKVTRMEMEMAGKTEDEIAARLVELGLSGDEEPEPARSPEPTLKKPAEGVDKDKKTDTIRVDGEDIEVEVDEILKAGKATLQKERNADRRQQEVSQYHKSVQEYERRVRENAARGLDVNGNPLTPAKADLPDKGVGEAVQEMTAKVSKAVFSGDEDVLKDALTELVTSVAQGRDKPTPPLDELVDRAAEKVETRAEKKARERKTALVNETFEKDFEDLYDDDQKFALTQAEFNRLRKAEPDADPVAHMRSAGEAIRKLFQQDSSLDDELARRREKKGRLPKPSAASGRMPTPEAPRPKSRSDVVSDMRRSRGLQ